MQLDFNFVSLLTAHEKRQLVVALLPNLTKLNGGARISHIEREDSERAFIRKFADELDKPDRLVQINSM